MARGYISFQNSSRNGPVLGAVFFCAFAACALSFLPGRAMAQSASTWNKRGAEAEAREDYDAAYEDYRQAHLKHPSDLRYKGRYERMIFQAGMSHVDRGRVLKQNGDFGGALTEFSRAIAIDPSNQTAYQEIDLIQKLQQSTAPPPPNQEQLANQDKTLATIGSITGPVSLQPVSNEPITLHMVEDVKVIYQAIGKAAGLNVLFDPDYSSKRIPVDLTNVSLTDALHIVGTISGTFYKPVTSNTIFVAQNTRTKRTDLDELAVQTFYLTNASAQADVQEVTTAIRNLLDPSVKVYPILSQNAIVMRATPDQLMLAQKLLNDLDRARSEVVVDVAVLEVNRDKVRNLGITLPQSFGLTPQLSNANTTTSATGTTPIGVGTTPVTNTSTLSLNNLAHLNATNFAVNITGGTLNALLTDSDTRILQNPRIRATDGQRASLKIGSKIPVATGSYNAGVSTGIASIGVQTQFTYLDVGVNIDMTPTVHYDREVTLKMKIEVSSQNGSVTIEGVTEPIISQRVIEQIIQLKEGEPSILAGILTKQDNYTNSGTPGLAELPLLKYFFGTIGKENIQDEVVFVLIPHIVRESLLSTLNTRAIDTGTGQSIELRHNAVAAMQAASRIPDPGLNGVRTESATTAASAASSMVQQLQQQAQHALPGQIQGLQPPAPGSQPQPIPATQPPTATAAGTNSQPASFTVEPPTTTQAVGSTFQVAVMLSNAHDVYSVPLQIQFDPAVLQLVNVDAGEFLGRDGQAVSLVHRDEGNGLVTISSSRPPGVAGVSGQGNVCTLTFRTLAPGDSKLSLVQVGARNSAQSILPAIGSQAVVHVK